MPTPISRFPAPADFRALRRLAGRPTGVTGGKLSSEIATPTFEHLYSIYPIGATAKGKTRDRAYFGRAKQAAEKRVGAVIIKPLLYPLVRTTAGHLFSTTPALGAPPLLNQEGSCLKCSPLQMRRGDALSPSGKVEHLPLAAAPSSKIYCDVISPRTRAAPALSPAASSAAASATKAWA